MYRGRSFHPCKYGVYMLEPQKSNTVFDPRHNARLSQVRRYLPRLQLGVRRVVSYEPSQPRHASAWWCLGALHHDMRPVAPPEKGRKRSASFAAP